MKNYLIITFLLLTIHLQAIAQNNSGGSSKKTSKKTNVNNNTKPQIDIDAQNAATMMCDCINKVLADIHPVLKKMMVTTLEKGEQAAQDELTQYMMTASETDMKKIQEDVLKLENMENAMDEQCQDFETRYKAYDNNPEFDQKVLDYLSQMPNCEITYAAYKSKQK
jgi:formate dehydrogenase maturation protein FdhE